MPRPSVVITALLISGLCAGFFVHQTSRKQDDAWVASSVKVDVGPSHGSGVQIAPGYYITAAHVIRDKNNIKVTAAHGGSAPAELLWLNEGIDVALLKVRDLVGVRVSPLECVRPSPIGMRVKLISNPGPFEFAHSWGRIASAVGKTGPWPSSIIVDIQSDGGSSGGPVLDMRGYVVGILVGKAVGISGFSIVVPSSALCGLLARA